MIREFIKELRAEFEARISRKTGWGKNEIMIEFEKAISGASIMTI